MQPCDRVKRLAFARLVSWIFDVTANMKHVICIISINWLTFFSRLTSCNHQPKNYHHKRHIFVCTFDSCFGICMLGGINYWPTEVACQMYRVKPSKLFTFVRSAKFTRIASKSSLFIQFTELIAGFPGFRQTLTAILRTYYLDILYNRFNRWGLANTPRYWSPSSCNCWAFPLAWSRFHEVTWLNLVMWGNEANILCYTNKRVCTSRTAA